MEVLERMVMDVRFVLDVEAVVWVLVRVGDSKLVDGRLKEDCGGKVGEVKLTVK